MQEEQKRNTRPEGGMQVGSKKLKAFFVKHLNMIYALKTHLLTRLPALAAEAHFKDLYMAIGEAVGDIEKQIARMEIIFQLLDTPVTRPMANVSIGLIDDAFAAIGTHHHDPALRDLSILFYLQNIEGLEMSSFQILQMAAVKLKNAQVKQLIKENYDEAKDDRTLILLIASKYMALK